MGYARCARAQSTEGPPLQEFAVKAKPALPFLSSCIQVSLHPCGPLSLSVAVGHLGHPRPSPPALSRPDLHRAPSGSASHSRSASCWVLCPVTAHLFGSSALCTALCVPVTSSDKIAFFFKWPIFSSNLLGTKISKAKEHDFLPQQWWPHYPKVRGIFLEQSFGFLWSHTQGVASCPALLEGRPAWDKWESGCAAWECPVHF